MNNLVNKFEKRQFILFGEIHGTKEIPNIILKLLKKVAKREDFDLCLEVPSLYQKQVDDYLKNGEEKNLLKINFFTDKNQRDGRNSLEYFNLIKGIYYLNRKYNRKIRIFFIDINKFDEFEKRENIFAERILKISKNKKVFAVLGNVHASKSVLSLNGEKIIPCGFILYNKLNDKLLNICFNCKSGYCFNNERKKVFQNDIDGYDIIYNIRETSECSFLE